VKSAPITEADNETRDVPTDGIGHLDMSILLIERQCGVLRHVLRRVGPSL
jgi:hypothetical protein